MQGLILEGTTEDSIRLSDNVELVNDLSPRQVRVEIHAAGASKAAIVAVEAGGGKIVLPAGDDQA